MPALLKTIVVRPKTNALRHYLGLEAERRNAAAAVPADFERAVRAQRLAAAMRCAQFEARHTGPFNWSGKEIK